MRTLDGSGPEIASFYAPPMRAAQEPRHDRPVSDANLSFPANKMSQSLLKSRYPSPSAARQPAIVPEAGLAAKYEQVRRLTDRLSQSLADEDMVIQSMTEASPTKWHLAHTSWFFETFVLAAWIPNYQPFHPQFEYLFNSYYHAVGPRWPRESRGLLSRPTVDEVRRYRAHVDEQMSRLFESLEEDAFGGVQSAVLLESTVLLGLHHEQQHQELILTDLKHAWSQNPLRPALRTADRQTGRPPRLHWQTFPQELVWIGHEGAGFAFDNESPRHRRWVDGFELASRLVTCAEYEQFIEDGGYRRPELWLSDGWAVRQANNWQAPLYWNREGEKWFLYSLGGYRPVHPDEPVCHVSYYEADAFARWAGARLPREEEWETAAADSACGGHFLEACRYHPAAVPARDDDGPTFQLYGDLWQWTASPYLAYPGYEPLPGALGEYNGKFMCNQFVLRGASCATPRTHARLTYRNFFPPEARWQFSGIRLARDAA